LDVREDEEELEEEEAERKALLFFSPRAAERAPSDDDCTPRFVVFALEGEEENDDAKPAAIIFSFLLSVGRETKMNQQTTKILKYKVLNYLVIKLSIPNARGDEYTRKVHTTTFLMNHLCARYRRRRTTL